MYVIKISLFCGEKLKGKLFTKIYVMHMFMRDGCMYYFQTFLTFSKSVLNDFFSKVGANATMFFLFTLCLGLF